MTGTSSFDSGFVIKLSLGVISAVLSAAIIASFTMLLSMSGRLTVIETIVSQTKEERRAQIEELRQTDRDLIQRIGALEQAVFQGRPESRWQRGRRDER